jgi:hypothetical protein
MRKIPSVFQRAWDGDRQALRAVTAGTEWVLAGEGVATRKWDGTCCLVRGGKLLKRYEVKAHGRPPQNFEPATDADPVTGKQQGWVPVGDGPEDQFHRAAWANSPNLPDGTYELVGPKVQGNVEKRDDYALLRHGAEVIESVPRDFDGLREFLASHDIEGIVFHHPDGRMAKVKTRDFGLPRSRSAKE